MALTTNLLNILILFCFFANGFCQIDKHGNPVFNSISIDEKNYSGYNIDANYYTISNNIANPNSSVFVSKEPSAEQVFEFATNLPSYFWVLYKDREIFKLVSLNQKSNSWSEVKWSFFVQDTKNGTSKEFPINIWMLHITEHRMLEIMHRDKMLEQKLMEPDKRIFHKFFGEKIYGVISYLKIYEKLLKLINEGKLYLPETDVAKVNFVDDKAEKPGNSNRVTSTEAFEELWFRSSHISNVMDFERSLNTNLEILEQKVSLSEESYPFLADFKFENSFIVKREPVAYLPLYADYHFTEKDSIVRFISYDWEIEKFGNLFNKLEIFKSEKQKFKLYNNEYERIKKLISKKLGTPKEEDKKAQTKKSKSGREDYLTRNTSWVNYNTNVSLNMIFAPMTYRIRANVFWNE